MSKLTLHPTEIGRWFRDNGDNTHNITYDLNENSKIIDLGGYTGVWANQMIEKYNPNVYILEPITRFYEGMINKFKDNDKVHLLNVGVSTENKKGKIFMSGDGTSTNFSTGQSLDVEFNTIETILEKWGLDEVDLIQINIEGDEYPLLEKMLETGSVNKFKNLQIQFHLGIKDDVSRREKIHEGLKSNGFNIKFNYPFVWEGWYKS
jgi:FkbM family methyltransferase